MGKEASEVELLELYMDLAEKQEEMIFTMSQLIKKQALELAHFRNMYRVEQSENMKNDENTVSMMIQEYNKMIPDKPEP